MRKKKFNYREGSIFAVPLQDETYVPGIVARMRGDGIVLGYFFAEQYPELFILDEVRHKNARDAIMVRLFGDLSLLSGEWPIIGTHPEWKREDWPMPAFVRTDSISGKKTLIHYSEDTIEEFHAEPLGTNFESLYHPEDGVSGSKAVEIRLEKILRERRSC